MWLVLLETNPNFEDLFRSIKNLNFKILYLTTSLEIFKLVEKQADEVLLISSYDHFEILSRLKLFKYFNSIYGVYGLKDCFLPLLYFLNINLMNKNNFYSLDLILNTKDKLKMRKRLSQLPYNPHYSIATKSDLIDLNEYINGIVLKPILGYGSIGVEKVDAAKDLNEAFNRSLSVLKKINHSVNSKLLYGKNSEDIIFSEKALLIEERILGIEVSVEVIAQNGHLKILGICGKSEMQAPFFEEVSYQMPALLSETYKKRIQTAAKDILNELNFKNGIAHMEFIINDSQTTLLDIGLRIGGSGLSHNLVYLSSGFNLVDFSIRNLLGLEIAMDIELTVNDISLLFLFQIEKGGIVANPITNQSIEDEPEFVTSHIFIKKGDKLTGYPDHSGLPGYALFKVNNRDDISYKRAEQLLLKSKSCYKVQYEESF
ncbi:MAG: ATP-grasp domain-containing protein [Bdellovibrionaceae bacterium]|nr:ATP-grasp domain-containing protein [Pseudobdellovibrionaceae bacterium]NUM58523.1 ATP-grasp domain-containing protein [Pseudobdellovibrionaceae bacterium]